MIGKSKLMSLKDLNDVPVHIWNERGSEEIDVKLREIKDLRSLYTGYILANQYMSFDWIMSGRGFYERAHTLRKRGGKVSSLKLREVAWESIG